MKSLAPKITWWNWFLIAAAAVAQTAFGDVTINSTTFKVGATSGNNTVSSNWVGTAFGISATVSVGANGNSVGFGNNSVTISNFAISSPINANLYIGNSSANNTLTLLPNTTWSDAGGNADLLVGAVNNASNNAVNILGGSFSLSGEDSFLSIGGGGTGVAITGANGNSLIVTNGGSLNVVADLFVGASYHNGTGGAGATTGGGNNTVILSNSVIDDSHSDGGFGINVGYGSSNNILTLLPNTVVIIAGSTRGGLDVGYGGPAFNNVITVSGALVTNTGPVSVGYGSSNNTLTLLPNTVVIGSVGGLTIANGGPAVSNMVTVSGALFTNTGKVIIGNSATSIANQLLVNNGGVVSNVAGLSVGGNGGSFNNLTISNYGKVFLDSGSVSVGSSGGNNNSVLVGAGGLLAASSLNVFSGGTGNSISNSGGIYQFNTATPTIANGGFGTIALNSGTVSFIGINNTNVSNSFGNGALSGISFSGANTFMLNAASNTTSGQTYDFQAVGGNPSNYAGLAMINGQTAYRGGDITVGTTGSMLLSNTLGTISGLVTNQGSLTVVGSSATFQSRVVNSGTVSIQNSVGTFNNGVINAGHWLTDPSTNVFGSFGYTNTTSGVISMAAGDVYIFTNTQASVAANFVNISTNNVANNMVNGKFLFTGGLGLTQALYVAGHDLGPAQLTPTLTATNAIIGYSSMPPGYTTNFAIGTLEISNFSTVRVDDAFLGMPGLGTNDNLVAGLYLQNLILGTGSLLIIDTNVQVYFENSNGWSLANIRLENNQSSVYGGDAFNYDNSIDGLHQIAVVPEPSVLLMVLAGTFTVWVTIRRQRRRKLS